MLSGDYRTVRWSYSCFGSMSQGVFYCTFGGIPRVVPNMRPICVGEEKSLPFAVAFVVSRSVSFPWLGF